MYDSGLVNFMIHDAQFILINIICSMYIIIFIYILYIYYHVTVYFNFCFMILIKNYVFKSPPKKKNFPYDA